MTIKEPIKIIPGNNLHLTLLMAPYSLNFVTGDDRQHLLAYGRDVFVAGQKFEADRAQRQAEPTPAYTCANAGTQGGACKQHCGDTARCWGNTTIALRPEAIDRAYRTVWSTVAHDYRLTAFAHEIVAEYQAQRHAAQVPGALTDEQDRALCEAYCIAASGDYFGARPQLDSAVNRRIFCAGHRKAWIDKADHGVPSR
jgi:hypothetical protein